MIRIKDVRESLLEQEIPGTLNVLRAISPQLESLGFDIEIIDTDHRTDSLRFYPVRKGDFDADKQQRSESIIKEAIEQTCSKCGTFQNVNKYPCHPDDWSVLYILCPDCYHKTLKIIPPILPGMLRDIEGRNVQNGDILMGVSKEGRFFWGLVVSNESTWGVFEAKNRFTKEDFMLLHNPHNFPTPLAYAEKFLIISNCGTFHNPSLGYDIHYDKYMVWLENNRNFDYKSFEEKLKEDL